MLCKYLVSWKKWKIDLEDTVQLCFNQHTRIQHDSGYNTVNMCLPTIDKTLYKYIYYLTLLSVPAITWILVVSHHQCYNRVPLYYNLFIWWISWDTRAPNFRIFGGVKFPE
jgi:hypothetical protein